MTYAILEDGRAHPTSCRCDIEGNCNFISTVEGSISHERKKTIMPRRGTQEYIVLWHIQKNFLSQYEAVMKYNITDLAGRIKRLKEKGWKIITVRRARTDSEGREVKHWNEYLLKK